MSTPSDEGDPRTTVRAPDGSAGPSAFAGTVAASQPLQPGAGAASVAHAWVQGQAPSQALKADLGDHALPVGTRLGEFEITQRIGEGGFSIVYLAWDHSLDRKVALKEYMPFSIAARGGHTQVVPRSERHRETFDLGLRSFINEAKLLAQFDHPALVKVYRFWEDHGTAYMVMPFYQGQTVRDTVRVMPQPPDEAWIAQLLLPLAQALKVIHAAQCYHRDIAPDNVILLADTGKPLLLDFGAARRVITGMTQQLTVILKPGYAPIEQYDEIPGMKQGPWTDVYALAAVVHWLVTGKTPPPSVGRMLRDAYVPLAEAARGRYSERFLAAVDRALAVMPDRRTASVEQLVSEMGLDLPLAAGPARPAAAHRPAPAVDLDATVILPRTPGPPTPQGGLATPPAAAPASAAVTAAASAPAAAPFIAPVPARAAAPDHRATNRLLLLGVAAAAALVVGAGWWLSRPPGAAVAPGGPSVGAGAATATGAPPSASPPPASLSSTSPPIASPRVSSPSPAPTPAPALGPSPAPALAPSPAPAAEAASSLPPAAAAVAPAPAAAPRPLPAPTQRAPQPAPQPVEARLAAPAGQPAAAAAEAQPRPAARGVERPARSNAAECASVLQRLSLGESSPELMDKVKALGCR